MERALAAALTGRSAGVRWWYARSIPAGLWAAAQGAMPTATRFAALAIAFTAATFLVALLTLVRPSHLGLGRSVPLLLLALAAMGSFEFVREAVRKPFVIADYLYDNSLYAKAMPGDGGFTVDAINRTGVLGAARWVSMRQIAPARRRAPAPKSSVVECQSCHTRNAYRGVQAYLAERQWDKDKIAAMLGSLDSMHGGVMPPFAGTDAERMALAAWLDEVRGPLPQPPATLDGASIFHHNCATCHESRAGDAALVCLTGMDAASAAATLASLPALDPRMPDLRLTEAERAALVHWVQTRFQTETR